jgi:hypothetical protein
MTINTSKFEFGLYIKLTRDYGNDVRLVVSVVRKSDDGKSIRGVLDSCTTKYEPRCPVSQRGRYLEDLGFAGFPYVERVGEGDVRDRNILIGYEIAYRDSHRVELSDAERMVSTLRRLERARQKWRAAHDNAPIEPWDQLEILAKFVGAKFITFKDVTGGNVRGTYSENTWSFLGIPLGVELYKEKLGELLAAYKGDR